MCCCAANKRKQFMLKMKLSNKQAVTLHYKWTIDWQWTSEWSNFNAGCHTLWSWIIQISKYNTFAIIHVCTLFCSGTEATEACHWYNQQKMTLCGLWAFLTGLLSCGSSVSFSIAHCVVLHYSFCCPVDHWGMENKMMSLQLSWYFNPILSHYIYLNMDRIAATDHPFKYLISLCICPSLSSPLSIIDLDSGLDTR